MKTNSFVECYVAAKGVSMKELTLPEKEIPNISGEGEGKKNQ